MTSPLQPPQTAFQPTAQDFAMSREGKQLTILCGPNNSGKSFLMKSICNLQGPRSHFFGCNRFFHIQQMESRLPDVNFLPNKYNNFVSRYRTGASNDETNDLPLELALRNLSDSQRERMFTLFNLLMNSTVSLQHIIRDNRMTPHYVDVDGESLMFGSSGTRLLLTLLATCFDNSFDRLYIDEPEMGLSPRIQAIVAHFLSDPAQRSEYLPHLRTIMVATHSHLFLDRVDLSNNFTVTKTANTIKTTVVESISAFHRLQFHLLGNDLEAIFMPSVVVIVEGKSDQIFLSRLFELRHPNKRITIVVAEGDGEVMRKLNVIKEAIGDLARSAYHNRIFALLDGIHSVKLERLAGQGIERSNIVVLSKNGIEYFYPRELMRQVFKCSDEQLDTFPEGSDVVTINGITRKKIKLAEEIAPKLETTTTLHPDIEAFLSKVAAVVD